MLILDKRAPYINFLLYLGKLHNPLKLKIMKTKLLVALYSLAMGLLISCSSEESQLVKNPSELTEDDFASQVEFASLSSATTRTNPTMPPYKKTKALISARIARKSRGCNSGFGLCDFKLFPKSSSFAAIEHSLAPDDFLFEVVLDEKSNTYEVNMPLAKPLPGGVSTEVSSLKIDEDIYWIKDNTTMAEINEVIAVSPTPEVTAIECNTELFATEVYKIDAGTIEYNPTLGVNGGYQVKLNSK